MMDAAARAAIKVLIVDDEHTLREGVASVLQAEGYDVKAVGRGALALETIKQMQFDIILVDLYMSGITDDYTPGAFKLLKAALEKDRDTLVVVMTGNPQLETSIEALRKGAWDYLPKPFSASHLTILVARAAHIVTQNKFRNKQQLTREAAYGLTAREVLTGIQEALRETRFSGSTGGDGIDEKANHYFIIDGLDDTPRMRVTISLEF